MAAGASGVVPPPNNHAGWRHEAPSTSTQYFSLFTRKPDKFVISENLASGNQCIVMVSRDLDHSRWLRLVHAGALPGILLSSTPIICYHALPRNCKNVGDIVSELIWVSVHCLDMQTWVS